ncbi:hypothetical protein B0H14DRAFT_855259 [Mycena olivaceomarginata]|nr:hypothetical protein B0H14DRAFT_855259 [Mycena olivaceomarginata]
MVSLLRLRISFLLCTPIFSQSLLLCEDLTQCHSGPKEKCSCAHLSLRSRALQNEHHSDLAVELLCWRPTSAIATMNAFSIKDYFGISKDILNPALVLGLWRE